MKFLDKKQYETKVNFYRRDARDRESYLLDPSRYHTNALEREKQTNIAAKEGQCHGAWDSSLFLWKTEQSLGRLGTKKIYFRGDWSTSGFAYK